MASKNNPDARKQQEVRKYDHPTDAHMATKKDMVVKELEQSIVEFFPNLPNNGKAVIAQDKTGFYVTGTAFIDAPVLDPYRNYYRSKFTVTEADGNYEVKAN